MANFAAEIHALAGTLGATIVSAHPDLIYLLVEKDVELVFGRSSFRSTGRIEVSMRPPAQPQECLISNSAKNMPSGGFSLTRDHASLVRDIQKRIIGPGKVLFAAIRKEYANGVAIAAHRSNRANALKAVYPAFQFKANHQGQRIDFHFYKGRADIVFSGHIGDDGRINVHRACGLPETALAVVSNL